MTPFHVLILLILILIVGGIHRVRHREGRGASSRAANKAQGSASLGLACAC
jgi:hypothetical protein